NADHGKVSRRSDAGRAAVTLLTSCCAPAAASPMVSGIMPFLPIRPSGRFHPTSLFRPECVAVIGAAPPEGSQVLDNLEAGGFAGQDLSGEAAGLEVVQHLAALGRGRADHRDALRAEKRSRMEAAGGADGEEGHDA